MAKRWLVHGKTWSTTSLLIAGVVMFYRFIIIALADEENLEHIAIDVVDNTILANIDTMVRITNQCRGVLG